jgi:hypothetical protein
MSFDFGGSLDFEPGDVASETNVDPDSLDYGSEQITESPDVPGDQVANQAENADFVNKTNPGSIDNAPAATDAGSTTQTFDDGSTLTTNADGTVTATNAPGTSTLDKLQAKAGEALTSAQDAIKKQLDQITPASISKAAEGYAKNLVKQVATQVIATQLPPSLQPYANRTLNSAINSANAASVSSLFNPQVPKAVTPSAPTNTAPAATNAGPSFQQFDDGSSLQTFEDGSTLAIDSAGKATSTPAPADPPVPTTQRFDDGSTLTTYPDGSTKATPAPADLDTSAKPTNAGATTVTNPDGSTTQTFDDGSTITTAADGKVTSTPAPVDDPQSNTRSLANAANQIVKANTPGTVNDINLALPPISAEAALATAAGLIPGSTAVANAIADAAGRTQGLLRQAQNQQTARVQSNTNAATGDWRVRLQLAPNSNYLYNAPDCGPLLWPLRDTDGVIFPYTPTIDLGYKANYTQYDLTHSNYRGYFYQNSYVDQVNIKGTFTAQDTAEANYLLAVIHFFRSSTKMFYGQDAERGAPPPLVFLSGLGDFQFNKHPCVVSQFNYNLPADVNYIRAQSTLSNGGNQLAARTRQTTLGNPIASTIQRLSSLGQKIFPGAVTAPFAPQGSLAAGNPTYVPTKMEISLTLLPIQTRSQVSKQFSVRGFANGNLLKGGFW